MAGKPRNLGERWGQYVVTHTKTVAFGALAFFVIVAAVGFQNITMSTDYRYFFGPKNPQLLEFDKLQRVYAKEDSILFVVAPDSGNVFNKQTFEGLEYLTAEGWKIPFSSRVDSLTNFQYSQAVGDDITVGSLVPDASLLTEKRLKEIRKIVLAEPLLKDRIISEKSNITAINVSITIPGNHPMEVPDVAKYAEELAAKFEAKYPGHKVYLTGLIMLNNAFVQANFKDMRTLLPLMYLSILVLIALLLRSVASVVSVLVVLVLSMLSGVAFFGWLNSPISPPAAMAPTIIITLAVADSIHYLYTALNLMRKGKDKQTALVESMRLNFLPIFLTSITTAIGFWSLNFSDIPPYNDLGNVVAFGVLCALVYSVTILPAMISWLPVRVKVNTQGTNAQWLENLGSWVVRHRRLAIVSMVGVAVFLGSQIPNIVLSEKWVEYFHKGNVFRQHTEFFTKELSGIYSMEYDLQSGAPEGVSDPVYLKTIDDFANWYRAQDGVVHVNVFTDTLKRLNQNMHGDKSEYYKLPGRKDLAAQYILLYEMSLPYGLDLTNQVSLDKSSTRFIVTTTDIETSHFLELNERAENWLHNNGAKPLHALGSGPSIMFAKVTARSIQSMIWGTFVAFLLIALTMMVALRSWKYGLISLIPNMIPAIMGFGVWALIIGQAGFAISTVASVTIGIIVDDTVHFLSKYVLYRRDENLSAAEAIRTTFGTVGPALVMTTVILLIGFSVLAMSDFRLNWTLGLLSAITVGIALLVDFILLPAILAVVDGRGEKETAS